MTRLAAALAALLALSLAAPVPAPAAGRGGPAEGLSEQQITQVRQINAYFNSLTSVRGRFTQLGPGGEFSEGAFFLLRPGKMRFEYEPPNPILVISDGAWVGIEDRRLRSTQKYPLATTPLSLMLADRVDLFAQARIVAVEERAGDVAVTVRARAGTTPGELTLIFGGADFSLKSWIVVDAQGLRTEVSLFDLVRGASLDPRLFWINDNLIFDTNTR